MWDGAYTYAHMIPVTHEDRRLVRELAKKVRSARAVELALDWAIENSTAPDPAFSPDVQMHVNLTKNYLERFRPMVLGQYLHAGIVAYWARARSDAVTNRPTAYWQFDVPADLLGAVQRRSFREGVDVLKAIANDYRQCLRSLLSEVPPREGRLRTVEIPVDRDIEEMYDRLVVLVGPYGWDVDALIERRFHEICRRKGVG